MKAETIQRRFEVYMDKQEIMSGIIDVLAPSNMPHKSWMLDGHIYEEVSTFELLPEELNSIVSAVITGSTALSIRHNQTALRIEFSDSKMERSDKVQRIPDTN